MDFGNYMAKLKQVVALNLKTSRLLVRCEIAELGWQNLNKL
jgi:hypothetical protein